LPARPGPGNRSTETDYLETRREKYQAEKKSGQEVRRAWLIALSKAAVVGGAYLVTVLVAWDPGQEMKWRLSVASSVVGLTVLIEYFTSIRPAKHWEEVHPVILSQLAAPFLEFLRNECKIVPRINILVPSRTYHFLWIYRGYFTVWWSAGMDNQPDVNISFPVWHGVSGECYRAKIPIYAPLKAVENEYKFPKRLRPLTSGIQAIISYPIYESPRKGKQSGKLIGVINLDSKTPNTYNILTEDKARAVVDERMQGLAMLIGQIYH
jgi:uncharacterized protein YggT (Ycf19 family)